MLKSILTWFKQYKKRILIFSTAIFAILIMFSVFAMPGIIKGVAEKQISKALGRKATLESVSFNPFGLTLNAHNFVMYEQDGNSQFVSFRQLRLSLSTASLFRFAPVADELSLDKLQLKLVRTKDHHYNFSDIQEHLKAQPKQEKDSGMPRFSINNISLTNSNIEFQDLAVAGGKTHQLDNIQLSIPFISTIPHLTKNYTDPSFSALLNDAPISFSGQTRPLHESMETALNIKLDQLELPQYMAYLPARLPIKLNSGKLTLDMQLLYKVHQNQQPELTINGLTRLDNLNLTEHTQTPLAAFKRLALVADNAELLSQHIKFKTITLDDPELNISRNKAGQFNLQQLFAGQPKQDHAPKNSKTAKQSKQTGNSLQLLVDEIQLNNGTVSFKDQQPASGFKTVLKEINLKLTGFSTKPGSQSAYQLAFNGDAGENFTASGTAAIAPVDISSDFKLSGLKLQKGWPYLQGFLTSPVKGELALQGKGHWSDADGARLEQARLQLNNANADYAQAERASIKQFSLENIRYFQKDNRLELDKASLDGGSIKISRTSDGKISIASLIRQSEVAKAEAQPSKEATKTTASKTGSAVKATKKVETASMKTVGKPFTWLLKNIVINNLDTDFTDNSLKTPVNLHLTRTRLETGNLTGPELSTMPIRFDSRLNQRGKINLNGQLTPQPFSFDGTTNLARLPLESMAGYLPENIKIVLLRGRLDSNLKLKLAMNRENKLVGSFSGSSGLRNLHMLDAVQEEDLLKWESLQLDQISGNLEPLRLNINEIALNNVFSRIAIRKDGTMNLQNLVEQPEAVADTETGTNSTAKQAEAKQIKVDKADESAKNQPDAASTKPLIKVNTVTVQDGTILFSDANLPRAFSTTFYRVGGRISGLSSELNTRAAVDLRGNLENHSPLLISGQINPLQDDLFVDLSISFRDIELSPASPYSGTYLGYLIDRGKLYLDLKYHIEDKQLKAENKILLDQFTFGKSVPSDKATKLPVKLGIALLKDKNGQINLDLPVSGRTDDPEFKIWGVVWQVVTNLFVKAVSSPFALLSSVFGSSEDISQISFAAGSASLTPESRHKLDTLLKGLSQRPGLNVEVSGFIDEKNDPEGYRHELLLQKMKQEKLLVTAKQQRGKGEISIDQISIEPQEHSEYLKKVYQKAQFPKPRNMVGLVKDLPDDEMTKLIIANTVVEPKDLQQLAATRASVVRQYLTEPGRLESERVFLNRGTINAPPKDSKDTASRVELTPVAL